MMMMMMVMNIMRNRKGFLVILWEEFECRIVKIYLFESDST